MNKSVTEKIKKLLALATSSNEHEAKLAAAKANKLLIKYNLTMQDVDFSEEKRNYENKTFTAPKRSVEDKFIFVILNSHFFVDVVIGRGATYFTKSGNRRTEFKYHFVGEEVNVEIAKYVHNFLTMKFKDLFNEFKKGCDGKPDRRAYYAGLQAGLNEQLSATRKEVTEETGLVVVPDPGLEKFKFSEFGRLGSKQFSGYGNDAASREAGHEQGKKLKIARGLGGGGKKSGGLLE